MGRIAQGLPYRDFVTIGLLVDKLMLKNETSIPTLGEIVPDCWIYVQDTSVKMGRIQIFNNWSPYMLKDPEHSVWIGLEYFCQEGDPFWSMSEEDTVKLAISELKKIGVLDDHSTVFDSCRARIKKAYPAYFDTYSQIDSLVEYLNGFENLYCIGRNGQHRYNINKGVVEGPYFSKGILICPAYVSSLHSYSPFCLYRDGLSTPEHP